MAYAKKSGARKKPASKLAKSTKLGKAYTKVMKKTKPGSGKRFAALTSSLKKKGAKTPGALAAYIGRKKYGKGKMAKMSAAGRKRGR